MTECEPSVPDYTITVEGDITSSTMQIIPPLYDEHRQILMQNAATRRTTQRLEISYRGGESTDYYATRSTMGAAGESNDFSGSIDAFNVVTGKAGILKTVLENAGLNVMFIVVDRISAPVRRIP